MEMPKKRILTKEKSIFGRMNVSSNDPPNPLPVELSVSRYKNEAGGRGSTNQPL